MDTLIKLIIKTSYSNRPDISRTNEIKINLSDFNERYKNKPVFEFKEYDKIEVSLSCEDKSVVIKLESYYYENMKNSNTYKSIYRQEDTLRTLRDGDYIVLSPGGDSSDMLVPGEYSIKIYSQTGSHEGFFNIIPNSVKWNSIIKIREYLENVVKGISYNIYLEKKCSKERQDISYANIELYRYLDSIQYKLLNHVKYIVDNPLLDIEKIYRLQNYSKNPNAKSQRWSSKNGIAYNQNILTKNVFYENHSYLTNKITENSIFKNILTYMQSILIEAEHEYIKVINNINNNKQNIEEQIISKQKQYREASKEANTYKVNLSRSSEINILKKDIDIYREKEIIIENNLNSLNKLKASLNFYINETWVKDIEFKYNTPDITAKILKILIIVKFI
ncbi:hypothetical protein [Faecalimicrobium dakarense]|uniref:hypothetical protein n=1 Tax=Faecalimicrobium dakarense TaxID=1301100 RepID=UPI0004B8F8B0|nr:hypothetical protein [[Clostridium] dakarense]